jgi:hypothetical protein
MQSARPVRFNKRGEVTLPFFVVDTPEFDLKDAYVSLTKVKQAATK